MAYLPTFKLIFMGVHAGKYTVRPMGIRHGI